MMKKRIILLLILVAMASRSRSVNGKASENLDNEIRESFASGKNASAIPPGGKEGSIADMFDRVLEKEFAEKEHPEDGGAQGSNTRSREILQQHQLLEARSANPRDTWQL